MVKSNITNRPISRHPSHLSRNLTRVRRRRVDSTIHTKTQTRQYYRHELVIPAIAGLHCNLHFLCSLTSPSLAYLAVLYIEETQPQVAFPYCAIVARPFVTMINAYNSYNVILTLYCMVLPCGNMSKSVNFRKLIHAIECYTKYGHIY